MPVNLFSLPIVIFSPLSSPALTQIAVLRAPLQGYPEDSSHAPHRGIPLVKQLLGATQENLLLLVFLTHLADGLYQRCEQQLIICYIGMHRLQQVLGNVRQRSASSSLLTRPAM